MDANGLSYRTVSLIEEAVECDNLEEVVNCFDTFGEYEVRSIVMKAMLSYPGVVQCPKVIQYYFNHIHNPRHRFTDGFDISTRILINGFCIEGIYQLIGDTIKYDYEDVAALCDEDEMRFLLSKRLIHPRSTVVDNVDYKMKMEVYMIWEFCSDHVNENIGREMISYLV